MSGGRLRRVHWLTAVGGPSADVRPLLHLTASAERTGGRDPPGSDFPGVRAVPILTGRRPGRGPAPVGLLSRRHGRSPMVLLKAQRLQRLAEKLGEIENRLEREGGETEVREGLEAAAARTGVDLETARALDAATLQRALSPGGRPDPGRAWAVAEVLFLDGLRARAEDDPAAAARRLEKARRLYRGVGDGLDLPEGASGAADRLRRIEELLGETD